MSLRRHTLHPADPEYLQPPIHCPNPDCEGGDIDDVGTQCGVCHGTSVIHDEQDIEDAYRWAEARGLRVTEALDALTEEAPDNPWWLDTSCLNRAKRPVRESDRIIEKEND